MEAEEQKLKTSLKSKKAVKKEKKKEHDEGGFKYYNSDDEEDEYFDRTKYTKFNSTAKTAMP